MIMTSLINHVAGASATATDDGFSATNVLTSNGTRWQYTGNATITITLDDVRDVSLVSLHNIQGNYWTITGKRGVTTVWANTYNKYDINGFEGNLSATDRGLIDSIEIAIEGAVCSIGYVWAGFGEQIKIDGEQLQVFNNNEDLTTVTLGNFVSSERRFSYRSFDFTTEKLLYGELYKLDNDLQLSGYGVPRPFVFTGCSNRYRVEPFTMLGIIDGNRAGFSFFDNTQGPGLITINSKGIDTGAGTALTFSNVTDQQRKSQLTYRVREVFGSV